MNEKIRIPFISVVCYFKWLFSEGGIPSINNHSCRSKQQLHLVLTTTDYILT